MFFYKSDVKEASGMLNIHFGLALIDTLNLIEEARRVNSNCQPDVLPVENMLRKLGLARINSDKRHDPEF